jgi:uncharacterized membrane protein
MADKIVLGIFKTDKMAMKSAQEFTEAKYTDHVSIISKYIKENNIDADTATLKESVSEGANTGAVTGGAAAAIMTLLAGVTAVSVPGLGVVTGWLATLIINAAGGATIGVLTGILVDLGLNENQAKKFQEMLSQGGTMVAVKTAHKYMPTAHKTMERYGARQIAVIEPA